MLKTNLKKLELQLEPLSDNMANLSAYLSLREVDDNIRDSNLRIEQLIEAVGAKIIKEISEEIKKYHNMKNVLEEADKQIVLKQEVATTSGLHKYPYPNARVGNKNLGSSKDPKSLTWPFGSDK